MESVADLIGVRRPKVLSILPSLVKGKAETVDA